MLILLQDMTQVSLSKQKQAKERKGAHHFHVQVQPFTRRKIKSCKMRLFFGGGIHVSQRIPCLSIMKTTG